MLTNMAVDSIVNERLTIDEKLHRSLKYKDSKEFVKFFNFIARFNHYSRFNTMLMYLQNDAVSFFGSTSYWKKKFNRFIREDARPYVILAPMAPVILAYDVMDTIGKDSPIEFLRKGLGSNPFDVTGELPQGLFDISFINAKALGINVLKKKQSYFMGGLITTIYAGKLEIVLNSDTNKKQQFSTLLHELAHLFLGHTGHKELLISTTQKRIKLPKRVLAKSVEELEAETVSYLLCKKLGLETKSAEYIAGYIKSEKDLEVFSYETVVRTADKIEDCFFTKNRFDKRGVQLRLFGELTN